MDFCTYLQDPLCPCLTCQPGGAGRHNKSQQLCVRAQQTLPVLPRSDSPAMDVQAMSVSFASGLIVGLLGLLLFGLLRGSPDNAVRVVNSSTKEAMTTACAEGVKSAEASTAASDRVSTSGKETAADTDGETAKPTQAPTANAASPTSPPTVTSPTSSPKLPTRQKEVDVDQH